MSKSSDASKIVYDFMAKENRPYAINGIVEKCGQGLGKATVQKCLDALVAKGEIIEKTFGKQKIYFVRQKTNLGEIKKELQACSQKLEQTANDLKTKQVAYRELEAKLRSAREVRSLESLEEEQSQLLDEIREMNEKLRRHEAKATEAKITAAEAQKIEKRYEQVTSAYRKRKRICNEMLDAILEGYPKPKKTLIEDIGVETDEAVGFQLEMKKL